jgi:hypothetical protein
MFLAWYGWALEFLTRFVLAPCRVASAIFSPCHFLSSQQQTTRPPVINFLTLSAFIRNYAVGASREARKGRNERGKRMFFGATLYFHY